MLSLFSKITPPQRHSVLKWPLFFFFSFLLLMWLSPDSFLMHICAWREDSAWFFTAGKAWMEGMTPYVDFADSKGPLLWLIYGIGYLLSPTSYVGVFWLSVLAYTLTFAFIWRTARLFVGWREAAFVLAIMPTLLFLRIYHNEVRAEDFCMPWVCIAIYCTCRALLGSDVALHRKWAFWLGFSMACCLLIKWNMFFMMGGTALVVAGLSLTKKRLDGVLFGILGILVVVMPFVVYFLVKGNFSAFVQEYFVNTFLITGRGKDSGGWHVVFLNLLTDRSSLYQAMTIIGVFAGIALFCRRFRVSYWLLFAYTPFFLFLGIEPSWHYYFAIVMPFYVFFLVFIANVLSNRFSRLSDMTFVAMGALVCLVGVVYNVHKENLMFFPSPDQKTWDEIQLVMHRKERPKIMVATDLGHGLLVKALPACKYWALQGNPSDAMIKSRHEAIKAGKPDFIIVTAKHKIESIDTLFYSVLRESGYRQCYVTVAENGKLLKKAVPVYERSR